MNNNLILKPIVSEEDRSLFISDIQQAFQSAYEKEFEKYDKVILPEEDILDSLNCENSKAFFFLDDNKIVGGAVFTVDEIKHFNSLHLLYVRNNIQNKGYGYRIWQKIEKLYPETRIWETHTPYYDKRNIHFYVNRCGFHIVEFFNEKHPDPHQEGGTAGNIPAEQNIFFRFEKYL